MDIYESLNSILVTLFNDILSIEEKALITEEFKDISVTDMHIIEAIGIRQPRTMTAISKSLGVTMGTLTVGINGLVKKGYVVRERGEKDRRVVYASLTLKGHRAFQHHTQFHKDMIDNITKGLSKEEASVLTKTCIKLEDYFGKWIPHN
ncbi:MAG: MarR family winged helix-turn-helix transcriptional regulator [Eubacteriales bacterium]|nr:MarR family winged helix-turn-helix transcriptional regulator [Eubacteriales bacterium]